MKKVFIITSSALILIIVILSILLLNITKTYVKIPEIIKCSKTTSLKDETKVNNIDEIYLKINKEQLLTHTKNLSTITYINKVIYKSMKDYYIKNKTLIKYDDKKLKITNYSKYIKIKDDKGKNVYSWYKNYVKLLEIDGYICK